jgi:hypothetical protein
MLPGSGPPDKSANTSEDVDEENGHWGMYQLEREL